MVAGWCQQLGPTSFYVPAGWKEGASFFSNFFREPEILSKGVLFSSDPSHPQAGGDVPPKLRTPQMRQVEGDLSEERQSEKNGQWALEQQMSILTF